MKNPNYLSEQDLASETVNITIDVSIDILSIYKKQGIENVHEALEEKIENPDLF